MCGILAYFSNNNITNLHTFIDKLKLLYHRGQDNVGVSYLCEGKLKSVSSNNFEELYKKTKNIKSKSILGHTKYTTSGKKNNSVNQPVLSNNKFGDYCLVFNGNIPIDKYVSSNIYSNDTAMIIDFLNIYSEKYKSWKELLEYFLEHFSRAYNIIIQTNHSLYILKDKFGVRPLTYTQIKNSNTYTFSSESCVFEKDDYITEIEAGTLYGLNKYGLKELIYFPNLFEKHCLFEYIYFLKNESLFQDTKIQSYRKNIGQLMAKRDKQYFDKLKHKFSDEEFIVCGVPNTGNDYAVSYAENIEIPFKNYILKNSKVSRTFILSTNEERNKYANVKYLFDKNIKGKNIILIDDSIVRGITLKNLLRNLKDFGVNKIYIIIASPPINNTCNYGIDIPTTEELVINNINEKNLSIYLGCEKIRYLDLELLNDALPDYNKKCTMCLKVSPNLEW